MILDALGRSPLFFAAALPLKVFPPLVQPLWRGPDLRHACRQCDPHPARHRVPHPQRPVDDRFPRGPGAYDGGELVVEDHFGVQRVKLPAGHAVLYPSSSLHHVTPVTRGVRVASFFWLQSMIRDDGARRILFDLDQSVQRLTGYAGRRRSIGDRADGRVPQSAAALGRRLTRSLLLKVYIVHEKARNLATFLRGGSAGSKSGREARQRESSRRNPILQALRPGGLTCSHGHEAGDQASIAFSAGERCSTNPRAVARDHMHRQPFAIGQRHRLGAEHGQRRRPGVGMHRLAWRTVTEATPLSSGRPVRGSSVWA
jgi:hypothetical protein